MSPSIPGKIRNLQYIECKKEKNIKVTGYFFSFLFECYLREYLSIGVTLYSCAPLLLLWKFT